MKYLVRAYCTQFHAPILIYNYRPDERLKFINSEFRPQTIRAGVFDWIISEGEWDNSITIFTPYSVYEYYYIEPDIFKQGNVQFPYTKILDVYQSTKTPLLHVNQKLMERYIK